MSVIAQRWSSTISGGILLPLTVALLAIGLPTLGRLLLKILREARANGNQIKSVNASFDTRMASIEKELRTNSGSSLKDAVIRIDERTLALDDKLDRHLTDSAGQVDRLNRHIDGAQCSPTTGGTP